MKTEELWFKKPRLNQAGKADLENFMQENFRLNLEVKELALLTGRSLATFKRDFEKTFRTSPKRWIQQRRLEEAFIMIKEQGKRPSEVYDELGFESFSHFSFSFKQYFGTNPSNIQSSRFIPVMLNQNK
ncbi:AraC-type DNA-binding protein [Pedobacter westerhofensis]|uniref:AraC-type DNA-binding protein n=1 Tax=Pedobacter westerhofensis TaxID=425512 RepID=A0A521FCK3_9SPHI|nr:AraC family transcriptional regulator [Pedobacter westerhofensis]SMO93764.1 AraC-type DNA-binding protein [Pedobacter westerhofensis]